MERISRKMLEKTLLNGKLHEALSQSLIPFGNSERPTTRAERLQLVNQLYQEIESGAYFPSVPRDYVTLNKHKGITRICPQFSYRDTCVYYFCIRQLTEIIASGHVEGTFGGWRGSVPQRKNERDEQLGDVQRISESLLLQDYETNSLFDPTSWVKEWGEFQRVIFAKSQQRVFNHYVKFDIANFYDSVNLDKIERSLRHTAGSDLMPVIDLLFVLLRHWNRRQEGYSSKTVGIPQNSSEDDCSRILANYYLQPYDREMRELSSKHNFEYVRYSDDQIIMLEDSSMADQILHNASIFLHELGLNLNSSKVIEFTSREDFSYYWCFDVFGHLSNKQDHDGIKYGASYFRCKAESHDDRPWRYETILKRLVSTGVGILEGEDREFVVREALKAENFAILDHRHLRNLDTLVQAGNERNSFEINIERTISTSLFTDRLWNLKKFYGNRISRAVDLSINTRLAAISIGLP